MATDRDPSQMVQPMILTCIEPADFQPPLRWQRVRVPDSLGDFSAFTYADLVHFSSTAVLASVLAEGLKPRRTGIRAIPDNLQTNEHDLYLRQTSAASIQTAQPRSLEASASQSSFALRSPTWLRLRTFCLRASTIVCVRSGLPPCISHFSPAVAGTSDRLRRPRY